MEMVRFFKNELELMSLTKFSSQAVIILLVFISLFHLLFHLRFLRYSLIKRANRNIGKDSCLSYESE